MLESSFSTEDCAIFTTPDKIFKYAVILIWDTNPVEYLIVTWADIEFPKTSRLSDNPDFYKDSISRYYLSSFDKFDSRVVGFPW